MEAGDHPLGVMLLVFPVSSAHIADRPESLVDREAAEVDSRGGVVTPVLLLDLFEGIFVELDDRPKERRQNKVKEEDLQCGYIQRAGPL